MPFNPDSADDPLGRPRSLVISRMTSPSRFVLYPIEVDWVGKTMRIADSVTGDSLTMYLFGRCPPFLLSCA